MRTIRSGPTRGVRYLAPAIAAIALLAAGSVSLAQERVEPSAPFGEPGA
jgi:hypothetical protein